MSKKNPKGVPQSISQFMRKPEVSILIPLLLLSIFTAILNPNFLSKSNIADTLNYVSLDFMIAAGMTYTIISGGMDLSVGSTVALGGYITGIALIHNIPVFFAVMLGLSVGMIIEIGRAHV